MVVGIHSRKEVGDRFAVSLGLFAHPVNAQAVAQTPEHSHEEHGGRYVVPLFLLIGQSNMAGRGVVKPQDQITNPRIFMFDQALNNLFSASACQRTGRCVGRNHAPTAS